MNCYKHTISFAQNGVSPVANRPLESESECLIVLRLNI